jgi:predicted TIM-barrel fold metal-dependent hydrolase
MNSGTEIAKSFITNYLQNREKQTIVFAHVAGPGGVYQFTIDVLTEFEEFMKSSEYSKLKNIYFEISGVLLDSNYPGKLDHQIFYEKMKSIGEERFLFGSDYPFRTSNTYFNQIRSEMEQNDLNLNSILTRNIFEN